MQNLNYTLVQTGQIINQLQCLFQNTPRQCIKQNSSGWGTNERILIVKDKKLIYGKVYQNFVQGISTELPQNYIKAFVNLQDIYEVCYLPNDKPSKKTLSILIPESRINQQQTQLNSQTAILTESKAQEKKQKFTKWIFHFQYDLKEKLIQIQQKRKQQNRKKNQLLNVFEQNFIKPNQITNFQLGNNTQSPGPNHSANQKEQQIPLSQYVNQIRKAKEYLKFKENREKLEKQQRRKNKQATSYQEVSYNDQEEKFPIASHWRQYFSALQQLQTMRNPDRTVYQYELIVYKQVHNFKQACISIFKNYIFEKINGISNEKWVFEKFYFYKGIWIKLAEQGKQKDLNQEFLIYYLVSDLVQLMNRQTKINYRVPNICLIDYLGWKALCMCDLPFSQIEKSQIYNLLNQSYDLQNASKIKQNLTIIQKALNIKYQDIQKQHKKVPAPLGPTVRIFQYNPKKDVKADQVTLESFYYMTNFSNIFPLDFNYQTPEKVNGECRFRPQIIGDVRDFLESDYDNTQLLSTAFMPSQMTQQLKTRQDDKVVKTSRFIQKIRIPELMDKLNNCQLIIIDSLSLKTYLSEFGINIRYLVNLHELSKLKYLRELIEIEALARTIKKMFRQSLKELIHEELSKNKDHFREELNRNLFQGIIDMDMQQSEGVNFGQTLQEKFRQDERKIVDYTIDYLNLIFGKGEETDLFWSILINKVHEKFKIKISYPFGGSPGSLLHSVLYHCSIQAIFSLQIPLFKTQAPFSVSNQIQLRSKVKCLQFPSFQIQKLIKNLPPIESIDHPQQQLLHQIALKLYKMDLLKNYYLYQNQMNYHLSMSKVSIIKEDMTKPQHYSSHHPSQITYFIKNKSEVNFQKGLNLMGFCYSDFHPIYVSFYDEYSQVYQPELLKKTAILQSIKCFGQFHMKTAQLYSHVYAEGFSQFYQKALRSKSIISSLSNTQGQFESGKYQSCMNYSLKQLKMSAEDDSRIKKQNCIEYLHMLFMGMKAAQKIRHLQESLKISQAISDLLNKFKLRNQQYHYELIKEILKIKMIKTNEKMFLYKLALLCIGIQNKYNENLRKDKFGYILPAQGEQKKILSAGIMNQYFTHDTHSMWLDNIFKHLLASFQYFNHLEDLFNNFQYHLSRYDNSFFKESLGYWDILVRLYGEKMFHDYLYETGNL